MTVIINSGVVKLGGTSIHIAVDPRATYLKTSSDPSALNAVAIDLAALGIAAGDVVVLERTGSFDRDGVGPDPDSTSGLGAVFSTSSTLSVSSNLNRVTGAVATDHAALGTQLPAFASQPTANGNLATNITKDFNVSGALGFASPSSAFARVPAGANFLFLTPDDSFFGDNTDPDGDFGINIYRPLVIAPTGIGAATITGTEYRDAIAVGVASGSNGTLTIASGAAVDIGGALTPDLGGETVNGSLLVGAKGKGTATIQDGSVVTVHSDGGATYSNVLIGQFMGGVGVVTVTGAGSQLISQGVDNGMYVGRQGTGTLNVTAGGEVETIGISAGREGTGTVNVSGAGSHLLVSSNGVGGYSNYANQAGSAGFGRISGSHGNLNVTNGAVFDVISVGTEENPQLRFARDKGSIGVGVVDGVGSEINIVQSAPSTHNYTGYAGPRLLVGVQGDGTLTVRNAGVVNITGENAQLLVSAAFEQGTPPTSLLSQSELIIQSGGIVTVDQQGVGFNTVSAGEDKFGNGAIRISGNGSKLVTEGVRDEIVIGNSGTGLLTVDSGGEVDGQRLFLGYHVGSSGTAQISGPGSNITLVGDGVYDPNTNARLFISSRGNATMTVSNSATVNLTGAASTIFVGDAYMGDASAGTGILTVQSGAVVTVDRGTGADGNLDTLIMGTHEFGDGTVTVTGAGSKIISIGSQDRIVVGEGGTGKLNVLAGGEVQGQFMSVGSEETGTGAVVVDGVASKITLSSPTVFDSYVGNAQIIVGDDGVGTMTVRNSGSVDIAGARAHLDVGHGQNAAGVGTLTIQSGGKVTVTNTDDSEPHGAIDIGSYGPGSGTVTVTGVGSTLTAAGADPLIDVGNYGAGVLNVLAGAHVVSLDMSVGNQVGGTGTLNIGGSGSKVILSNDTHTSGFSGDIYGGSMIVGNRYGASGAINITTGGVLEIRNSVGGNENAPRMNVGYLAGSVGVVTVAGNGSAINITQVGGVYGYDRGGAALQVGKYGDGTLIVKNNAQVNITGEYGLFRVSRGDASAYESAPLSEAFVLSGADVKMTMTGGTYYGAVAMIGRHANANGRLTVDGSGSTFTVLGDNIGSSYSQTARLFVARQGQGELVVTSGANVLIDGGDDKRPVLSIGVLDASFGTLSIAGGGSTLTIQTTNTDSDGGGLIQVGRDSGSNGIMNISSGAKVINDLNSTNSVMTVGQAGAYYYSAASVGSVTVDGNGNANTLLDGGQLLVIGAGWSGYDSTLASVDFFNGGIGSVQVMDSAIVRANLIAVGQGGTIGGNATFDGSVTVDGGGTIAPGASPGRLTITGGLDLVNATLDMEVDGTAAGTKYDQIKVAGPVTLGNVELNIITGAAFNFADNNRIVLIDGNAGLTVADLNAISVQVTGEPGTLGYQIADEGSDLVFEALNNGVGPALVTFGTSSAIGANATIGDGIGSGTGGRFDEVRFVNATGLEGTAGSDNFTASGTQAVTLVGNNGTDVLTGADGSDIIDGGAGVDTLTGGLGDDTLLGGGGNDILIGGAGDDELTGGANFDQFIFNDFVLSGDFGNDLITDFAGGAGLGDVIQIDDAWGFSSAAEVIAAFQVVGADKVLTVGDDSITLVGKAGLTLNVDDFLII